MEKIYLNTLLEEVIENNSKVKDMFYYLEDDYESKLSFNDLQLWYLDIVEMDLNNWLYNYLANELLKTIG